MEFKTPCCCHIIKANSEGQYICPSCLLSYDESTGKVVEIVENSKKSREKIEDSMEEI